MLRDHCSIIEQVCDVIAKCDMPRASNIILNEYPFVPLSKAGRKYTERQKLKVFLRDGFIDRYRGDRLVFPPVLRVLSMYLPNEFPYHKNGNMEKGHIAYWELFPTIDHVTPVARGGTDDESNWVCCSMITNGIKSNWTLDQLRWELLPPGSLDQWDGLIGWFLEQMKRDPALRKSNALRPWYNAAMDHSIWPIRHASDS